MTASWNFCDIFNHLQLNFREKFKGRKNDPYFCSFLEKKCTSGAKNQFEKPSKKRLIFHQTI
jgi:hypothetical protein